VKKEKDEASQKRLGLIEEEIGKLEREYADLEEIWKAEKATAQGSAQVKEEIDKIKFQIEELKRKGDFNKVAELQYGKLPELDKRLKEAQAKEAGKKGGPQAAAHQVGAEEIAEVVSRATGIPVSKMMQGERDKLLQMETKLHERVVGQDEAIVAVSDAIRRSAPACPTRTGRWAASCSWAPPAWARPSCARRWRASCSTARTT
jgi:ATP-dependent Clp protease ATP-binding subunit ClpB